MFIKILIRMVFDRSFGRPMVGARHNFHSGTRYPRKAKALTLVYSLLLVSSIELSSGENTEW